MDGEEGSIRVVGGWDDQAGGAWSGCLKHVELKRRVDEKGAVVIEVSDGDKDPHNAEVLHGLDGQIEHQDAQGRIGFAEAFSVYSPGRPEDAGACVQRKEVGLTLLTASLEEGVLQAGGGAGAVEAVHAGVLAHVGHEGAFGTLFLHTVAQL